jgi:lipopolysaccharide transport system permease protein
MTDQSRLQDGSTAEMPAARSLTWQEPPSEVRLTDERESDLEAEVNARTIFHIVSEQQVGGSYLQDLWSARQLLLVLIGRDLRVRYKQTIFGPLWVVLQPLLTVGAYSIIFGLVAKVPSEGVPYPIFLLSGLLPWIFFQRLVLEASASVTANTNLVGKIYFPRLILPLATLGSLTVDLLVGFGVALMAMALFGFFPGPQIVLLPLVIMFAGIAGLSIGLVLAPIDVNYRDVRMVVPIVLQFVMFLSPIFYSAKLVPESFRLYYDANPIAIISTNVRWMLLNHGGPASFGSTMLSLILVGATFCLGVWLFVRAEARFADRI